MVARKFGMLVCAVVLFACVAQVQAVVFVDNFDVASGDAAALGYTVAQPYGGTSIVPTAGSINVAPDTGVLHMASSTIGQPIASAIRTDEVLTAGTWSVSTKLVGAAMSTGDPYWMYGLIVSETADPASDWLVLKWNGWSGWNMAYQIDGNLLYSTLTGLADYTPGCTISIEGNADGTFNLLVNGAGMTNVPVVELSFFGEVVGQFSSLDTAKFGVFAGGADTSGTFEFDFDDLTATVVPEPATMCLLAFGGVAVVTRRRKR